MTILDRGAKGRALEFVGLRMRRYQTGQGQGQGRRVARGERFKFPVYDSRAPRARSKSVQTVALRPGHRERSRSRLP